MGEGSAVAGGDDSRAETQSLGSRSKRSANGALEILAPSKSVSTPVIRRRPRRFVLEVANAD